MSAPVVTGAIALWLQANPSLSTADVRDIIKNTSYRVAARHLDPPLRRDVCIITRDEETVPIACKRFVRFLLDRCGQTV